MTASVAQALATAGALGIARLDAQLLLLHALGRTDSERAWLVAHDTDIVPSEVETSFRELCARRAGGEPVAYIVGRKEFFGLALVVDRRVLVPRPETETLVDWALEVLDCDPELRAHPGRVQGSGPRGPAAQRITHRVDDGHPLVLDLGTGSGAIALAIKKHCPGAEVHAVDASAPALEVAAANAAALALEVAFREASWLSGCDQRYQLIVSNPPYVAAADPHLTALVREPLSALASGIDGLDDIRAIVSQSPAHLLPGGWLLLEHGWDQAERVRGLLAAAGFGQLASRRDLAGIERCSGGRWLELG